MDQISVAPSPAATGREAAFDTLRRRFGPAFSTAEAVRRHHASVECLHPDLPPDAVLYPASTDEVAEAMAICSAAGVPVIAYGAGTSLEGHVLAPQGGLTLDLSRMNAVLEVNDADLDARVQAGVTRKQINIHLRDRGLFFPVDPGADATLGGMAATRASGTTTVRYGNMRANVLGLTVVTADGRIVRTGGRARKSSAGYDLTGLFIGSEGTLGIITELRIRLHPIAERIAAAVCPFPTLEHAIAAVTEAIQMGSPVARIEFLDGVSMRAVNAHNGTRHPEQPTLFLEFHGSPAGVEDQVERFREVAEAHGGGPFDWAAREEDRNRLWDARHNAYFAALGQRPGHRAIATDVCVPISALADAVAQASADIEREGLYGPILGHVGDGNFHAILLVDEHDAEAVARVRGVIARMVERALAAGGTCTGEHGIGIGKRAYLEAEHGDAVDLMRAVKAALDPAGILNPGKVV